MLDGRQISILLAEDEDDLRGFMKRLLQEALPNASITEVSNGADLLHNLHNAGFDLLVTDNFMPHHNGEEVIRRLKAGELFRPPKATLIVSGAIVWIPPRGESIVSLSKPFRANEFVDCVKQLLALENSQSQPKARAA